MANDNVQHDDVQHGIDDNPSGDPGKSAVLGGVGGAVVGALAGGPVGAVVGAVAGALASGVGVAAVDSVDNDDTVSGIGGSDSSGSHSSGSGGHDHASTAGATTAGVTADTHNTVGTGYSATDHADVHAQSAVPNTAPLAAQTTESSMSNDHNNHPHVTNTTDVDTMRVPVVEETVNVNKDVH